MGEEDETGEQRWCHSKLSCFISLIWVKRGKLKNPQKTNKSALLLLSRYAAQWAVVGGLPDADGMQKTRLPLWLTLHHKMQLINLCPRGRLRRPQTERLRQSRHALLLSPVDPQIYKTDLSQHQAQVSLSSWPQQAVKLD